jgi:PAS domain S-box-containing protein
MQSSEPDIDHRQLLEQAPDAVIYADTAGVVRYWNAGAERIFGHTAAKAIGQRLDFVVPEQFREAHWTGFDRAIADGDTKYRGQALPTRAERADGTTIYVELSFAILQDASGATKGALACARDITERFEHDRTSRRRLRELEQELEQLRSSAG